MDDDIMSIHFFDIKELDENIQSSCNKLVEMNSNNLNEFIEFIIMHYDLSISKTFLSEILEDYILFCNGDDL